MILCAHFFCLEADQITFLDNPARRQEQHNSNYVVVCCELCVSSHLLRKPMCGAAFPCKGSDGMRMTQESIDTFLTAQKESGASKDALRQRKGFVTFLYRWLPEDKELTKERLALWREEMQREGYSQQTILNYVKGINLYLDYMGWSQIRFNRGRAKDIKDIPFGYLTPLEPTGGKCRKDHLWRCQCRCGNIVELPATRLLLGNTLSCGCMKAEHILSASKYIGGTHLVLSLKEDEKKTDTRSGYTGVSPKRDKWYAHITYRGKRYHLGTYSNMEDAVKARARAKEMVMEDALQLLGDFEKLHKDDCKPNTEALPKAKPELSRDDEEKTPFLTVKRSDNTSGYPGVIRKRDKWAAKITYQKITYQLGSFLRIEDAIAVRKEAERKLKEDPCAFIEGQGLKKELCV